MPTHEELKKLAEAYLAAVANCKYPKKSIALLRAQDEFRAAASPLTILSLLAEADGLKKERRLMAMLACDTPQFDNPLVAWQAQSRRDEILKESP